MVDIKNKIKFDGSLSSTIMGQICSMMSLIERTQLCKRIKAGMAVPKVKEKMKARNRGCN